MTSLPTQRGLRFARIGNQFRRITGPARDDLNRDLFSSSLPHLIQNLQKTGYFRNIEIKETFQDDTFKELQAFQFTLTCEKGKS